MKIFLTIIIAFLSQIVNAQTNIYHKFPESSAFWNFHLVSYSSQGGSCDGSQNYSILVTGDTIINDTVYHKLNIPYIQSFDSPCGESVGYKGAFRQDTILKKVYFIPPSQNSEELLYDFNLQVGDTLKGYLATLLLGSYDVVASIDSVLVGSSFRKRWNLSDSCYNILIIEGVGSTYGLIELSGSCLTTKNYSLNCFNQNGISLYPDSANNCEQITQINSFDSSPSKIKIFPNPSNGVFTVDFDASLSISEIILFDLLGNIILKQPINNQTEFIINNVQSGTYIISLIKKNGSIAIRKIISSDGNNR